MSGCVEDIYLEYGTLAPVTVAIVKAVLCRLYYYV